MDQPAYDRGVRHVFSKSFVDIHAKIRIFLLDLIPDLIASFGMARTILPDDSDVLSLGSNRGIIASGVEDHVAGLRDRFSNAYFIEMFPDLVLSIDSNLSIKSLIRGVVFTTVNWVLFEGKVYAEYSEINESKISYLFLKPFREMYLINHLLEYLLRFRVACDRTFSFDLCSVRQANTCCPISLGQNL